MTELECATLAKEVNRLKVCMAGREIVYHRAIEILDSVINYLATV